jgi:hypothetical protein
MGSTESQVEALASIYSADRQDGNNMEIISMTALGFGLSYISLSVAGTAYLSGKELGWLLALLPLPVLIVIAWHSVFLATGVRRKKSATLLENYLIQQSGIEIDEEEMGVRAIETILNAEHPDTKVGAKVTLLFGYAGSAVISLGFTAACIARGIGHVHPLALVASGLVYSAVAIAVTSNYRTAIEQARSPVLSGRG